MVSQTTKSGRPKPIGKDNPDKSDGRVPLEAPACCMDDLEQELLVEGLDSAPLHGFLEATIKQYNSYLEKWMVFFVENQVSPRKPKILGDFLPGYL